MTTFDLRLTHRRAMTLDGRVWSEWCFNGMCERWGKGDPCWVECDCECHAEGETP